MYATDLNEDDLWIGVHTTRRFFTYIGCGSFFSNANSLGSSEFKAHINVYNTSHTVTNLGNCRLATGCKTFGIKKDTQKIECICVENARIAPSTACNSNCSTDEFDYACGKEGGLYFSVYTEEKDMVCNEGDGHCLMFSYADGKKRFEWNSCVQDPPIKMLCSNTSLLDNTSLAAPLDEFSRHWKEAVNECFKHQRYPASYQSIKDGIYDDTYNQKHWTGVMRQYSPITIYESDLTCSTFNQNSKAGYIKQVGDRFKVMFENQNTTKRSLCLQDTGTDHTTSSKQTPTPTSSGTSPVHLLSTTEKIKGEDVATVAAVSVVLFLVFVAVITILIVLRKRGLLICPHKRQEKGTVILEAPLLISEPVFEMTTSKQQNEMLSEHCYFLLESATKSDMISHLSSSEPEGIPQEDQYSYAEDTTDYNRSNKRTDDYDNVTKTDDDKKNEDERERSFNVYNKLLQNKPNEEYDHINDTSSAKINIDSQYHCTEAETGDTYSHLHPQVFGKHITDNTYNVTESSTSDGDYNSVVNSGRAGAIKPIFNSNYDKVALYRLNSK